MSVNRRELLTGLGAATASSLLWALGCRTPPPESLATRASSDDVATWLRDAIARLATAFPGAAESAHAIALASTRTTTAIDVLGRGIASGRREGAVLRIRAADGSWREQTTNELSRGGIEAATRELVGTAAPQPTRSFDFGPVATIAPLAGRDPTTLDENALFERVHAMADPSHSSRIIYAASSLDIDDASVWSVAIGRQRAQRLVRIRRAIVRIAYTHAQPVIRERAIGWRGGVDDHELAAITIANAARDALEPMTPGDFTDGDYLVELSPAVVAAIVDAAAHALLTTRAARRPEVAARLAIGTKLASPLVTLVDDPTAAGAYGGFAFDDEGTDAAALTLIEGGRVVGRLADRHGSLACAGAVPPGRGVRAGHLGELAPAPTHLRLATGDGTTGKLVADGLRVDYPRACTIDAATDRISIVAGRAGEIHHSDDTGHKWADVELVGELAPMLAAVTAVSREVEQFALRDAGDAGDPLRWRSIEAPAIATRIHVRGRRG